LYTAGGGSKSTVLRVAPLIRGKFSRANALRLDQTLTVVRDDGKAILADILTALYPRQNLCSGNFRQEVALAATEAGVKLSLETDGQTRSAPADLCIRIWRQDAAHLGRQAWLLPRHACRARAWSAGLRVVPGRVARHLRVS